MRTWSESFTAAVVVTGPDQGLELDVTACRHHFTVATRAGGLRHLIFTDMGSDELSQKLSSLGLEPALMGRYALMDSALPEPSEQEASRGLLVGFTDCRSTEEYDAFNHWYDGTHGADVLRSGIYWSACRFRLQAGDAPEFLACYESTRPGPEALRALMAHYEDHPSPVDPICTIRHVWPFDRHDEQSPME